MCKDLGKSLDLTRNLVGVHILNKDLNFSNNLRTTIVYDNYKGMLKIPLKVFILYM